MDMPAMYGPYDRGNYFKPLFAADLKIWHRAVEGFVKWPIGPLIWASHWYCKIMALCLARVMKMYWP